MPALYVHACGHMTGCVTYIAPAGRGSHHSRSWPWRYKVISMHICTCAAAVLQQAYMYRSLTAVACCCRANSSPHIACSPYETHATAGLTAAHTSHAVHTRRRCHAGLGHVVQLMNWAVCDILLGCMVASIQGVPACKARKAKALIRALNLMRVSAWQWPWFHDHLASPDPDTDSRHGLGKW